MNRYLSQLLEDLAELAETPPPAPYVDGADEDELAIMRHVLEWEQAPLQPVEDIMSIGKEAFPPAERLTEPQIESLIAAITHLWASRNWQPDFLRDDIPAALRYKLLVDKWDEPSQYISGGTMHVEFCSYRPDECPFGERYCFCKGVHDFLDTLPDEDPDWE